MDSRSEVGLPLFSQAEIPPSKYPKQLSHMRENYDISPEYNLARNNKAKSVVNGLTNFMDRLKPGIR